MEIDCKPGPDAQDRLHLLFTILLEHAAAERQAAPVGATPYDDADEEG